ncbi:MAG TPA: AmmeMemoRadiSam system protein B, partial [Aggregatilineales bacterium]|nr:AmmeMemoRadiSam system protein B [Aggregatilineales bacterium]
MRYNAPDRRPSPIAGTWYPGDPETLIAMMEDYLSAAEPLPDTTNVVGLLAPHAGYRYSGSTAAKAFAQVRGRSVDTVVILGPLHRPMPNVAGAVVTSAHTAYETPLGLVEVDHDLLNALNGAVRLGTVRNDPEHSIEIELPFLQYVLEPGFKFVPLMLVNQSRTRDLSNALVKVFKGRSVLLVASSDLSHFNPQPVAHTLDHTMLAAVEAMDAGQVIDVQRKNLGYACGYGAIATVIDTVKGLYAEPGVMLI